MKPTFYFRHDYNARNDEKLLRIRTRFNNAEGYGLFWFVIESMHERDGHLDGSAIAELALTYSVPQKKMQAFIDECVAIGLLHRAEDGRLTSPRVLAHIEFRKERQASGKKGAIAKRERKNSSATPQLPLKSKGNSSRKRSSKREEDNTTNNCGDAPQSLQPHLVPIAMWLITNMTAWKFRTYEQLRDYMDASYRAAVEFTSDKKLIYNLEEIAAACIQTWSDAKRIDFNPTLATVKKTLLKRAPLTDPEHQKAVPRLVKKFKDLEPVILTAKSPAISPPDDVQPTA